jgi:PAS domain S-box-containing protein
VRLTSPSLRAKLLWGTVLVTLPVMVGIIGVIQHHQRASIVHEFQRRGDVLARNLAALSHGPLLLYNFTALEQTVARVAAEDDVVYAIVLDAEAKVAAHSASAEQIGVVLSGPVDQRAVAADRAIVQETRDAAGAGLYDFAAPVVVDRQRWGTVRVGLSTERMDAEIVRMRWELAALAGATLLVGGVMAAVMARRIAGPVQQLAAGAAAISRGDLNQRIEPVTDDELGRLASAFNHMAGQLARERAALEEANAELRRGIGELADLKSYTDSILGSLTSGVVTVDLEGRIVTVNQAAELLTGFFAGEVVGRYCTEAFAPTPEVGEILMETLATRTVAPGTPIALRRRNGTALAVEFSAAPLKGGDGKDLGVVGVLRDVTTVRDLEQQLRRSDRLAALGTLAAGLAHEIKNPLTSLLTFSRHLVRRFDDPQFRLSFQRVVPRELERINTIVEGLLELARPTRPASQRVRLPALLERALELYASEVEARGVRVTREYARDVPAVYGDEEGLYQAFVNLVTNALDAMATGGRLTLRVGWADAPPAVPGRWRSASRRVRVEIEDSGVGIPPAHADRVFNPFFTTKEQGTGLGLALAHKIVEDHGGAIAFTSAPGAGTTFRVVLPVVPDPASAPPAPEDRLR